MNKTRKRMRGYKSLRPSRQFPFWGGNTRRKGGRDIFKVFYIFSFFFSKYFWWEDSSNKIGNNDQNANKRLQCWKHCLWSNRFATALLVATYQKDKITSRHSSKFQMMGSGMITCQVTVCNLLSFEVFEIWLAKQLLRITFSFVYFFSVLVYEINRSWSADRKFISGWLLCDIMEGAMSLDGKCTIHTQVQKYFFIINKYIGQLKQIYW